MFLNYFIFTYPKLTIVQADKRPGQRGEAESPTKVHLRTSQSEAAAVGEILSRIRRQDGRMHDRGEKREQEQQVKEGDRK